MAERVRSVEVVVTVDTNKQTKSRRFTPYEGESWSDFMARVAEATEELLDVG